MPGWSTLTTAYRDHIYATGRQPLFMLLAAFVSGFAFIRVSTRMIRANVSWWPGNVAPGGLHIHHVVFGVGLMLVGGTGGFSDIGGTTPWAEILACVFGVGAALVLDEFALILHLKDVYWSEAGRSSVDAVILATALTGLLVLGASPFGVGDRSDDPSSWGIVALAVQNMVLVLITSIKGKHWTGAIGIVLPVLALVGAIRLARPGSPWARARYREGSRKLRRAWARERRVHDRLTRAKVRFSDLIAGRPDVPTT